MIKSPQLGSAVDYPLIFSRKKLECSIGNMKLPEGHVMAKSKEIETHRSWEV